MNVECIGKIITTMIAAFDSQHIATISLIIPIEIRAHRGFSHTHTNTESVRSIIKHHRRIQPFMPYQFHNETLFSVLLFFPH